MEGLAPRLTQRLPGVNCVHFVNWLSRSRAIARDSLRWVQETVGHSDAASQVLPGEAGGPQEAEPTSKET